MTLIEKMARAMVEIDSGPQDSVLFDIHWTEFREGYMQNVLVALRAAREPTEAMVMEMERVTNVDDAAEAWTAAIDAALSEAERVSKEG